MGKTVFTALVRVGIYMTLRDARKIDAILLTPSRTYLSSTSCTGYAQLTIIVL